MPNTQDTIYEVIYGEIASSVSHILDIRIAKNNRHKAFSIISDNMEMTIFFENSFMHILAVSHYKRSQFDSDLCKKNSSAIYDMYSKDFPNKMVSDIVSYFETKDPSEASLHRRTHD